MTWIDEVRELGKDMVAGEQRSGQMCPKCHGGHSREKTMSIVRTDKDEIKAMCHRASCDMKWEISMKPLLIEHDIKPDPLKKIKPRWDMDKFVLNPLTDEQKNEFREKFGLTVERMIFADWRWEPNHDRLWMPFRSMYGVPTGGCLRSFDPKKSPKAININTKAAMLHYCWYSPATATEKGDPIVVVEDQISALRTSLKYRSLALLGTNFSDDLAGAIKYRDNKHLVIVLDRDAFSKALKIQERLNPLFEKVRVINPKRDIKDMNEKEFRDFLDQVGG